MRNAPEPVAVLAVAFFLPFSLAISCSPAASTPTPVLSVKETPEVAEPKANVPQNIPPGAEEPVRLAVQDLSRRSSVPVEQIQVEKVEEVEWRDSSLGCPQPGKAYAQVILPGYRITLQAQGKTYDYHSDRGQRVILCERPS